MEMEFHSSKEHRSNLDKKMKPALIVIGIMFIIGALVWIILNGFTPQSIGLLAGGFLVIVIFVIVTISEGMTKTVRLTDDYVQLESKFSNKTIRFDEMTELYKAEMSGQMAIIIYGKSKMHNLGIGAGFSEEDKKILLYTIKERTGLEVKNPYQKR